jgi:hypothetical protein
LPQTIPGRVERIEPIRFSAFVIWPEAAPGVLEDATAAWLNEPVLLAHARRLREAALRNYESRGPPLRPGSFFDAALRIVGHTGTALLLCHLVAKAFARGGEAVQWRAMDRRRGAFSDGARVHVPILRHADGVLRPAELGAPTMFYLLFAANALGAADTGDWYRFFGLAALAALTAAGGCGPVEPLPDGPALRLARRVERIAVALRDPVVANEPNYQAWLWANALSFAEWGIWGRSQPRAMEAGRIAIAATTFGLARAGREPDAGWRWWVPRAGGLRPDDASVRDCVAEVLTPADGMAA